MSPPRKPHRTAPHGDSRSQQPPPWRAWLEGMRAADEGSDERPTGLVLSGGGSRASFQLGALRYLYDVVGIHPTVIAGTSAGSIIAAMIAQGGNREAQRSYLAELEQIWRTMTDSSEMFTELPWFAQLRTRGPLWLETLERRERRQGTLGRSFQRVAQLREEITHRVAADAGAGEGTPGIVTTDTAMAEPRSASPATASTGTPASAVSPTAAEEPRSSEVPAWHPTKVLESLERLRILGRAGPELVEILRGAQQARSMFVAGPRVEELLSSGAFEPDRVAASGVQLRVSLVGLESGELRYVTEDGVLVDREDVPVPGEEQVDLDLAVRASCAIPMVLPPVVIGTETYVDGGMRESLPADVAQRLLGARPCYAVLAGPTAGLPRESSYADKDMLAIMLRTTTGIMADELQRDEAVAAEHAGATVIAPEFDVHETLTVTPGLTAIAIDYGYLRAAEAHLGADAEQQRRGREIIKLRRRIWRLEEELFAPPEGDASEAGTSATAAIDAVAGMEAVTQTDESASPDATDPFTATRARLATRKKELRDVVAQVPQAHLPPGAEGWWVTWERHTFEIDETPDWLGEQPSA